MKRNIELPTDECAACAEELYGRNPHIHEQGGKREICLCEDCGEECGLDLGLEDSDDEVDSPTFDRIDAWAKMARVLRWTDRVVDSVEDIKDFFDDLCGVLVWHPDDAFEEYVDGEGKRTFTPNDAAVLDKRMLECFDVCAKAKIPDLYALGLEAMQRAGQAPKSDAECMSEACLLLADLRATFEFPGHISVVHHGYDFAFGTVDGVFSGDVGIENGGGARDGLGGSIPETSTAEQMAAYVRQAVAKHEQETRSPILSGLWAVQTENMIELRVSLCVTKGEKDVEVSVLDGEGNDLIPPGRTFAKAEEAKAVVEQALLDLLNTLKA